MSHTSESWHRRIGREGDGSAWSQHEQICNDDGIAALVIQHDGSPEGNANANLATAAPELLSALKVARAQLIDHYDREEPDADYWADGGTGKETMDIVEAAIARAKGGAS